MSDEALPRCTVFVPFAAVSSWPPSSFYSAFASFLGIGPRHSPISHQRVDLKHIERWMFLEDARSPASWGEKRHSSHVVVATRPPSTILLVNTE